MIRLICFTLILTSLDSACHAQIERIKSFYEQAHESAEMNAISFVQPEMKLVDKYSSLKQIVLIRHGEPALIKRGWFNKKEAMEFIKNYDSVGVEPFEVLPWMLRPGDVKTIYTSSINRARHTANLIFGDYIDYKSDPIFREFERKIISYPNIKKPLKFWLLSSRISWLLGANDKNIESFKEARARAHKATDKLILCAEEQKKAVLVAHGFLNRQLVKNLRKRGWHLVRKGGSGYLAASLLVKID